MHTRITAPTSLVHPKAKAPKRSSAGAAGHDICCVAGLHGVDLSKWKPNQLADWAAMEARGYQELKPGESFLFRTGFCQAIPEGYVCLLWDRGGMGAVKCVHRLAGVIDEDYRGEWLVRLVNHSTDAIVRIDVGDKIVQGIYQEYAIVNCPVVHILPETVRGADGFGSTDKPSTLEPVPTTETADDPAFSLKIATEPVLEPVTPVTLLARELAPADSETGSDATVAVLDETAAGKPALLPGEDASSSAVLLEEDDELSEDFADRAAMATGGESSPLQPMPLAIPEPPEELKHLIHAGEILYIGQNATRALSCMRDGQRQAAAEWISRDRTFFPDGAPPIDLTTMRSIMSKEAVAFKPLEA